MHQIHVDMEGGRGAVNPREEVDQTVFGGDQGRDDATARDACVEAEGASAQSTPSFVPINHGIGIWCIPTAVTSEVNQIVKVGQRLG